MKRLLVLFASLYLLPGFLLAEADWTARYNGTGNGNDEARAIVVGPDDSVYVTGYSYTGTRTGIDYATIKYEGTTGNQRWVKFYAGKDGNYNDYATAMAVDASGNIYVTGYSDTSGTPNYDYATVKYNAAGDQKWVKRYNGAGNGADYAFAIAVDGSGNVYVTGAGYGSGGEDYNYATIKYDTDGTQKWVAIYNGPANDNDYARAICVDGSGNVYVTGYSESTGVGYDYLTIKYNSSGQELWKARYNGTGNGADSAVAIAVDGSGNVYVTGASWNGSNMDYLTIKYNSSGIQQWAQTYNGTGNGADYARAMAMDQNNNVYVTGASWGGSTDSMDYATIKYNSSGTQMWTTRYNPLRRNDYGYGIAVDSIARNVYVTGASLITTADSMDYATIQYFTIGSTVTQVKVERYNNGGDDYAFAIAYRVGKFYVTGASWNGLNYDYLTIQYSMQTGVEEQKPEISQPAISLLGTASSAALGMTLIRYSLPKEGEVSLQIFDVSGRLVRTLAQGYEEAGVYTTSWDGRDEQGRKMAQGVYLYVLNTDSQTVSNKGVLLR